jgi:undecaprenyl-diphosphatase
MPLLVVALVGWLVFALITAAVVAHPDPFDIDTSISDTLFSWTHGSSVLTAAGLALDAVGGTIVELVAVVVVCLMLVRGQRGLLAGYLLASALGGVVLNSLVKDWVGRQRPSTVGSILNESTASYPSGHATSGITVVAALGLVSLVALGPRLRWWFAAPLLVLGPLIGLSRVAVGVHWPTDVLGGWALGTAWTATVALAIVAMAARRAREDAHGS